MGHVSPSATLPALPQPQRLLRGIRLRLKAPLQPLCIDSAIPESLPLKLPAFPRCSLLASIVKSSAIKVSADRQTKIHFITFEGTPSDDNYPPAVELTPALATAAS